MASINIKFTCGCGYYTYSLEAAVKHSEAEHHTLWAHGEIRTAKEPKVPRVTGKTFERATVPVGAEFDALREKLGK